MGHNHHVSSKNTGTAILLNILISVAQISGGIFSGSISLISDAIHNLSDVISLTLSYFTNRLSRKPKNHLYTFGYKRAEILSALFNSATLVVIAVLLIVEAVKRIMKPEQIKPDIVIYFALASIFVNAVSVMLLHNDAKKSLNIKSSYLHLLTDVLTSVVVLAGGIIMKYTDIFIIDGILSVLIAFYLIFASYKIIKETIRILMHSTPRDIDLVDIRDQILCLKNIDNLKNVHLWQLNENEKYFEANVILDNDLSVSEFDNIANNINNILKKHNIENVFLMPKNKH